MKSASSAVALAFGALFALSGCRTMDMEVVHDSGLHDAARDTAADTVHPSDVPAVTDVVTGVDTPTALDVAPTDVPTAMDTVAMDVAAMDVTTTDTSPRDAGAPTDAGVTNACVAAGGMCVPLSPGSCPAPGMFGGPSCGTGIGVSCCMPGDAGGGAVTCTSVGGTCVGLSPTSCPAPHTVGDARMYTCGSGIGTECCLPAADAGASGAPVCMHAGSATEGWYTADGTLLCTDACTGLTPMCQRTGAAQGWYTTSGHGCPPYSTLIVHDPACM